jgi:hypothetical protein
MTSPTPDEYQTATLIGGLPTATFRARPYHRTITNIVVGNTVTSNVRVYRGQIGSVPVAQNDIGANNTLGGTIRIPSGQVVFVQWSVAGTPVSGAFARVSWTRSDNPLDDNAPATAHTWDTNAINSLVIPNTAGAGTARLVIGSLFPPPLDTYLFFGTTKAAAAIIYYSGTPSNDDYQFDAIVQTPGAHFVYRGTVLNGAMNEYSAGRPVGYYTVFDGGGNASFTHQGDAAITGKFAVGGTATSYIRGQGTFPNPVAIFDYIHAQDPSVGFPDTPETWHALTLVNGWTGSLKVLMGASPPQTWWLRGAIVAGTKVDGTTVANLPGAYIPANAHDIVCSAFGGALSAAQLPHLNVTTAGAINIFGMNTETNLNVNGSVSNTF